QSVPTRRSTATSFGASSAFLNTSLARFGTGKGFEAGGVANSVVIAILRSNVACITSKCRGPARCCVEHGLFRSVYEGCVRLCDSRYTGLMTAGTPAAIKALVAQSRERSRRRGIDPERV